MREQCQQIDEELGATCENFYDKCDQWGCDSIKDCFWTNACWPCITAASEAVVAAEERSE